jgi:hypothetical protein
MKRKSLFTILTALIIASIAASAVAISGTTYTWEKTFEVTKPEIECEIKIGNCRIIGCPVKIWVFLKLDNGCGQCCWRGYEDRWENKCDDWKEPCKFCSINGTYSADLHWWNETSQDWQHVKQLQEETNITISCWKHRETYTFTPEHEGQYKVVVTFTADSETYNFTSED